MLQQVIREVLGHALGKRGDEHTFLLCRALPNLIDEIVDLALGRLDCDFRINKAGWANNLLHVLALGGRELEVAWGCGHVDGLANAFFEFVEG